MEILKILDCKQDYKYQGPRYRKLGPESGEEFREDYLIPWLEKNKEEDDLQVDFEGTVVYTPSFLEEAFGGAIRNGFAKVKVIKFINIPYEQEERIKGYISKAKVKAS